MQILIASIAALEGDDLALDAIVDACLEIGASHSQAIQVASVILSMRGDADCVRIFRNAVN